MSVQECSSARVQWCMSAVVHECNGARVQWCKECRYMAVQ